MRVGEHDVDLLVDGEQAFPAMLDAIARARDRVLLEMYWIGDDAVGRAFRAELASAAARGVRVCVVVDGFGSLALPRDFWSVVRTRGGEVATFRPLGAWLDSPSARVVLARDHRKLLVCDDVAFAGGLNLNALWLPRRDGGDGWRDTAVRVRGPVLPAHVAALIEDTRARIHGAPAPSPPPMMWSTDSGKLGVLANRPHERRRRRIRQAYLWAIRNAKKSVDITCSYFAPRRLFVRCLARAVVRGARVRLLLPSKSDVALADFLARPWVSVLDELGVEVYAYERGMLHAKTAVVDGARVTVGSHNLDTLSWAYNLECNVFVDDEAFGRRATDVFEEDLAGAVRLKGARTGLRDVLATVMCFASERFHGR